VGAALARSFSLVRGHFWLVLAGMLGLAVLILGLARFRHWI